MFGSLFGDTLPAQGSFTLPWTGTAVTWDFTDESIASTFNGVAGGGENGIPIGGGVLTGDTSGDARADIDEELFGMEWRGVGSFTVGNCIVCGENVFVSLKN